MYEYEIEWNTKPAPGSAYYEGTSPFRSNYSDLDEVQGQFVRSLERNGWHRSQITIKSIKRVK